MNTLALTCMIFSVNLVFNGSLAKAAECDKVTRILNNEGYIETPGYTDGENYPKDVTCKWLIMGPTGSNVSIEFESFDLEKSKICTFYDYVTLRQRCTGATETSLGENGYCGTRRPPKVNTTCNELHITFYSDDSETGRGFRAKYKIIKDSAAPVIKCFGDENCVKDLNATATETITFHCFVRGYPWPKIYWERANLSPLNTDAIADNGTLTIPSLRYPDDSGGYVCIANNSLGEDRASATLTVKPKCPCPSKITTNWYHSPPFVIKDSNNEHTTGIFPVLIDQMIAECCGNCSHGHGRSKVLYKIPKESMNDVKAAIANKDVVHMSFPVAGKETDDEHKGEYYRPLFSSPGVAVLVMKEDSGETARGLLISVVSTWPFLFLTLVMAWLAGIVMWGLDTWYNPTEFPRPFHRGVFEGFWWAFVTMTTVGYGDRSPKGYAARAFAIVWVLIGAVIISITTGAITTSLTAITLSTDLKLYGAKMGALVNSKEYRLGVIKNSHLVGFNDLQSMFSKLESRNLKGIFLDSFVAGANKDMISDSVRVNKILDYDSSYGIVFRGAMASEKLQKCFNDYTSSKKGIISTIVEENTDPVKAPKESASEEKASALFSAETTMFKNALYTCLGTLALLSACGILWDYAYRRHFKKDSDYDDLALIAGPTYETVKANMKLLDSLMQDVQKFNNVWTKRLEETLKKHEDEYKEFSTQQAKPVAYAM